MRVTRTYDSGSALAASSPPKPPPTITTCGRGSLSSVSIAGPTLLQAARDLERARKPLGSGSTRRDLGLPRQATEAQPRRLVLDGAEPLQRQLLLAPAALQPAEREARLERDADQAVRRRRVDHRLELL